ncbi:hypothetical protein D0Y65_015802 [Glycine soja]|uniref:Uncharacterized protein n=1 Tax=Glycine soja TaxID=3848 RepID=A0A445KEB4_GLYSO|nr:hypothetical protein D0Y65_015802 [Glycine soja]
MDMKKVTCAVLIAAASVSAVVAATEVPAPAPGPSSGASASLPLIGSLAGTIHSGKYFSPLLNIGTTDDISDLSYGLRCTHNKSTHIHRMTSNGLHGSSNTSSNRSRALSSVHNLHV